MNDTSAAAVPSTPRPAVSVDEAVEAAAVLYQLVGSVKELGSQQDRNFRFSAPTGRFLLKFTNPDFSVAELDAQNVAMQQLTAHGIACPIPIPSINGLLLEESPSDAVGYSRLTSFVEGEPLTDVGFLNASVVAEMGDLCARTVVALAPLEHPGLDRHLQWDLRHAANVVEQLAHHIEDDNRRTHVQGAVADAWDLIQAVSADLRVQPIHGDLTDDNVVASTGSDGRLHPFGVIDLGDVSRSWLVGELAITCSSILHHNPRDPMAVLPAIQAFHNLVPLTDSELAAIWPMIVVRGGVLAVSGEAQVATDPTNDYARSNLPHEWLVFDVASSLPCAVATRAIFDALGVAQPATAPAPQRKPRPMFGKISNKVTVVDLSTTSLSLNDGAWLDPDIEGHVFAAALADADVAVARYGEARLSQSQIRSMDAPFNHALHVEVATVGETAVKAPFRGSVERVTKSSLVLRTPDFDLRISGVKPALQKGATVPAGALLGHTNKRYGHRVQIQICTVPDLDPPVFVTPPMGEAWREVCPDPTWLLGIETGAITSDESALMLRKASLASVSHHYYDNPPQIERGWQTQLIDTNGRSYLDMCNNVSSVGHSHPRIAEAAFQQWQLLNTNSRFHYSAIGEYAQRLIALLPESLDTVLLVNSGSEAVDLALRIAQIYTRSPLVVSQSEAYHGWTMASDAVSASTADNPAALTTRPDWTRFVATPNWYRGQHRGVDAVAGYLGDAATSLELWAQQAGIAAFICEPVFGNGGGVLLPDGYLAGMYDLIHAYGGLAIADEVQVGGGRLGETFWGFQQQGVLPDIVTIAKPFGNGQPLGAVITRREIADALATQGNQFSSAGGNPVSCRIGIEVLDILADEDLQANALAMGARLRERLLQLAERHEIIGAVHGMGLYMGIELVRDRDSLEPATVEASAICDRLLDLGVIEQPASDRINILKIKPPMCIAEADIDFYVDALDEVLTTGW